MSDLRVKPVPRGPSSAKAFRFSLDARALAHAEEMSLVRAGHPELPLTIEQLRSPLNDALSTVWEAAAARVHPHAHTRAGDRWWRRSA